MTLDEHLGTREVLGIDTWRKEGKKSEETDNIFVQYLKYNWKIQEQGEKVVRGAVGDVSIYPFLQTLLSTIMQSMDSCFERTVNDSMS